MIKICFVNESTVVTDAEVQQCLAALEIQANQHFAPIWGTEQVALSFLAKGTDPAPGVWQLVFADNSDQAGALGYHEVTLHGEPLGFVFCKDDLTYGESWTVTASHELLEMIGDPWINRVIEVDSEKGSAFYMSEVSDAVEDDSFGYEIPVGDKAVRVSDFVYPAYFAPGDPGPFDHLKHVTKALEILTNGYLALLNLSGGEQWTQITGRLLNKPLARVMPTSYHRRFRRLSIPRSQWKRSDPRAQ